MTVPLNYIISQISLQRKLLFHNSIGAFRRKADYKNENQGVNKKTDTIAYYVLKLYLSDNVAVNASSGYNIAENLEETDKGWGYLIGNEATALSKIRTLSEDGDGNITEDWLKDGLQWAYHDMDTFVNTNVTNKLTMHKTVDMETLTEDATTTDFTYTLYEKRNGAEWVVLPNIAYTVYEGTDIVKTDKTDENGQLQLRHNQTVEFDAPQFVTLRLVEDNTGKYRLKADDEGNLTEDALVIGDSTLTNVHEISNGFSMDTETEVPDGMPVGNDVAITRMIFKEHNYFYMGMRFAELADIGTVARKKEESFIYNRIDNDTKNIVGYTNDITKNLPKIVTPISLYTPPASDNATNTCFTADTTVEYVYVYDKSKKNCCGDAIWSMWSGITGLVAINNTSAAAATKQINRTNKGSTGEDNNLGYINPNYCFDNHYPQLKHIRD